MKKKHFLWLAFCLFVHSISAQTSDFQIHLSVSTRDATCQGNGEIHCSVTYDGQLQLEQFRFFYIPLSGLDSIVETSVPSVTHLRPGHYKVKVSALCHTGLDSGDAYIILSDSIEDVVVGSRYIIPFSGMIYNIFSFSAPYGIVPSLDCEPTGKIQIKMQNGTFPYYFDIWKITATDTVFCKSVSFDHYEHLGDDSTRHDYKHYYTMDSLEPGNYKILCHDGCGYYTPYLFATVPHVRHYNSNRLHLLRNSSGIPESRNILTFKEMSDNISYVGHNDDYYRRDSTRHHVMFYRFINPTLSSINDTTPWRQMPVFETSTFLYDTLDKLQDYGQVWGRQVILQLQPYCSDTLFSYTFDLYCHRGNLIYLGQDTENYTQDPASYDYCGYKSLHFEYDAINKKIVCEHTLNYCYDMPDSIYCRNYYGYTLGNESLHPSTGSFYQSYLSFPLKHHIVNLTQDTLVSSGEIPGLEYLWRYNLLENRDFHDDTLFVSITDQHDNPLITSLIRYPRFNSHYQYGGEYRRNTWKEWEEDLDGDNFCPDQPHHLGIYQTYGFTYTVPIEGEHHYIYEKDTVCIVESPDGNKYNLTAIANSSGDWDVSWQNSENHATLQNHLFRDAQTNKQYIGLLLTDTNLSPGRYVWIVYRDCAANDTIIQDFYYELPEITENPVYRLDTTCTALNITPIQGQYSRNGADVETFFQVYTSDTLTHTASAVRKNGTMSIGIPGTYKIAMYTIPHNNEALLAKNPCYVTDTTIEWHNETIELEYIYGHVCNESDTEGFVRVKGIKGMKPYFYKLFSSLNGSGSLIASNTDGIFDQVPVHFGQTVSVELTDACNAHFITNLIISDMDKIRKCWTENGENDVVLSEGDTCYFYGLSLGGVTYHWTGPDGFSRNEQNVSIAASSPAVAGIYYLEIEGGGCGILRDSIRVRIREKPCPQVSDYDQNIYNAIRINGLCWTQSNLRTTHYSDGRPIDSVRIYEYPEFSLEQIVDIFGMLYRWSDAVDTAHLVYVDAAHHIQGACPEGWYIPTQEQYDRLSLWGSAALRSPEYWINGAAGTNETGFSALPAGFYNGFRQRYENLLGETRFWSDQTDFFSENKRLYILNYFCSDMIFSEKNDSDAYSIRCVLAE